MQLFYSQNSPFARKCRVIAREKGIQLTETAVNAMDDPPELLAANPLGKIPALVLENGTVLCESPVICEYLDSLKPAPRFIPEGGARWEVLNLAALANGIMDAAVAMVLEGRRPADKQWDGWRARQTGKIARAIEVAAPNALVKSGELNLGTMNLAIALAYVSFRQPQIEWAGKHPALAKWLEGMNARESFKVTAPAAS